MKDKLNSLDLKKVIKSLTIGFGLILIVFISFFDATFDFAKIKWYDWLARTSVLVGIMIFGILMGNSTGTDIQKEKVNGLYQQKCNDYNEISAEIQAIKIFFSQFWLWYKARKLIEKKIDYLVDNQFDIRVAKVIVNEIEKEDCVVGKLGFDENEPLEKIYVKNDIKFKKLTNEQLQVVLGTFNITLDTYGDSYYLSLYDDGIVKVNEAEKGKALAEKIKKDKRNSFIIKISSSLVISIVFSALTVYDFVSGGEEGAMRKAWLNLISRLTALITSYVSGFSTAIVNVRDQARAIENKVNVLTEFKVSTEKKMFIPETYEEMLEREFKAQEEDKKKKLEPIHIELV